MVRKQAGACVRLPAFHLLYFLLFRRPGVSGKRTPGAVEKPHNRFPDLAFARSGLPRINQTSGAKQKNAPRERYFISSLPGLTRQSMLTDGSLVFASLQSSHFSMDHRVKPGGDEFRTYGAIRRSRAKSVRIA